MTTAKEQLEAERIAANKAQRRAEDFRMITNPNCWPVWPLLPMKRYKGSHGSPDTAVVTESAEHAGKVLLFDDVLLFMFPHNMRGERVTGVALTADEILDQGWTVD